MGGSGRSGVHLFGTSVPLRHLQHLDNLDATADFLFPQDSVSTSAAAVQHALLSPFNARVDLFNWLILERLPERVGIPILLVTIPWNLTPFARWQDSLFTLLWLTLDLLSVLNEPGVPSHELSLKIGAVTSVMRNLSSEKNLDKNVRKQVLTC